jgi:16S rRNA (guanine966-N2)-methyltransferase
MRVITGSARGRRLGELKGMETRPTTDKVKESIFNCIQFDVEDARVLDLFAGTGQLGIEALSRGAKSALGIDPANGREIYIAKDENGNPYRTYTYDAAQQVICGDSLAALGTQSGRFDIIFLDPPYESGLLEQAMEKIAQFDILSPHGIMVAESPQNQTLHELPAPYGLYREYRYGKIKVSIYHRAVEEEA